MRSYIAAAAMFALSACNAGTETAGDEAQGSDPSPVANFADTMRSTDPSPDVTPAPDIPDSEARPVMQLQVVLDRQGFGPGVIDGAMGISTANALKGFQEANGLEITGAPDEATTAKLASWRNIAATRVVTIPADWSGETYRPVPKEPAEQAKLTLLGYVSLDERLAERFHTTVEMLQQLNPGGRPAGMIPLAAPTPTGYASAKPASDEHQPIFRAGQLIRVPNIGADRIAAEVPDDTTWQQTLVSLGVGSEQPEVARIVVDKSEKWLKGYDAAGKLVAMFTVTSGSSHDPLPLGEWGINGVGHNPPFAYDPALFWDVSDSKDKLQLPPGPNGPVGVVWIDLTRKHYGIHGTPHPETIGRAESHGCVRLTNWDAARLAGMVDGSTKVLFQA